MIRSLRSRVIRASAALAIAAALVPAPARADALRAGGDVAVGVAAVWLERSTASGWNDHLAPEVSALVGVAALGRVRAGLDLRWATLAESDGSGTVSVDTRHHLLAGGVRAYVPWRAARLGAFVLALADVASTSAVIDGMSSKDASGTRAGVRYGVDGALRLTGRWFLGLDAGGLRRDAKNDVAVGLRLSWEWGETE